MGIHSHILIMDTPETDQITKTIAESEQMIPSMSLAPNAEELKSEYQDILRLSKKLADSIDYISKAGGDGENNEQVRDFCLDAGIPADFSKERLLFKKSVLNRIQESMFANPDIMPGGPAATTLDVSNISSIKQLEQVIEYAPLTKYLLS